jgi:hypothetical protein
MQQAAFNEAWQEHFPAGAVREKRLLCRFTRWDARACELWTIHKEPQGSHALGTDAFHLVDTFGFGCANSSGLAIRYCPLPGIATLVS